jgi:murein DD-endopeptidase MepM/ murein hydrolase activator NlpD
VDRVVIESVLVVSLILAATPPTHLRALAPDAFDAPAPEATLASRTTQSRRIAQADATPDSGAIDGVPADLQWPLRPAPDLDVFGYHGVGYFVDHDPRFPSLVQDYTCGERSYDLTTGYNHGGTDYYLWPYPWLMMDLGQIEIVAAAPGVVIEKIDGNFDRDCAIAGNGGFNAVFVQQDDGLTAFYLHMRSGSLTTRAVGARVAAGDFLGLVGSSGPSSLPHLHFELQDRTGAVVDPLHGACNDAPDRWVVPQPYESPRIDTLTTHSAEPEFVDCGVENGVPVHEDPHFDDTFAPGETLWAFASYSDHRNGEITHFSVVGPDLAVLTSWDFDLAGENLPKPFYSGTAWDWSVTLPADAEAGTWTLQAELAGQTYRHAFEVEASAPVPRGHSRHARPAGGAPQR